MFIRGIWWKKGLDIQGEGRIENGRVCAKDVDKYGMAVDRILREFSGAIKRQKKRNFSTARNRFSTGGGG